jgi:hypothetical protein
MNQHLAEISKCVSVSAIALLILDGAGWHSSPQTHPAREYRAHAASVLRA